MARFSVWLLFAVSLAQLAPSSFCLCWFFPCNNAQAEQVCQHETHDSEKCPCHHEDGDSAPCDCPCLHVSAPDVLLVQRYDQSFDIGTEVDSPFSFPLECRVIHNPPEFHSYHAGPGVPLYLCFLAIVI